MKYSQCFSGALKYSVPLLITTLTLFVLNAVRFHSMVSVLSADAFYAVLAIFLTFITFVATFLISSHFKSLKNSTEVGLAYLPEIRRELVMSRVHLHHLARNSYRGCSEIPEFYLKSRTARELLGEYEFCVLPPLNSIRQTVLNNNATFDLTSDSQISAMQTAELIHSQVDQQQLPSVIEFSTSHNLRNELASKDNV